MPIKLNLLNGVVFLTCTSDPLFGRYYLRLGELIVNSVLQDLQYYQKLFTTILLDGLIVLSHILVLMNFLWMYRMS